MALLEIKNLHLAFGKTSVLDGISLSLEPKEVLCIVGESGSGKSVTALSIARLLASPPAACTAIASAMWLGVPNPGEIAMVAACGFFTRISSRVLPSLTCESDRTAHAAYSLNSMASGETSV